MMWFKHDPGPCPVDDAPHTTCVGPSPQGINDPSTPPRNQPGAPTVPRIIGSLTQPTARTVTTKTYTRAWWRALQKGRS